MIAQTNHQITKCSGKEIKFDTADLFMNGENHRGKTPPSEFKVTTPENPLLSITSIKNITKLFGLS